MTLKALHTPVVLSLALGQKTIDARKEFKLPWRTQRRKRRTTRPVPPASTRRCSMC